MAAAHPGPRLAAAGAADGRAGAAGRRAAACRPDKTVRGPEAPDRRDPRRLAGDAHPALVYGSICVDASTRASEMVATARVLSLEVTPPALEREARRRLPAFGALGGIRNKAKHRSPWRGSGFRPLEHLVRFQAGEPWHALG